MYRDMQNCNPCLQVLSVNSTIRVQTAAILETLAVPALLVERLHASHNSGKSLEPTVQLDLSLRLRGLWPTSGVSPQLGEEVRAVRAGLQSNLYRRSDNLEPNRPSIREAVHSLTGTYRENALDYEVVEFLQGHVVRLAKGGG